MDVVVCAGYTGLNASWGENAKEKKILKTFRRLLQEGGCYMNSAWWL